MIPRTKIVATIGPASDSEEMLEALIEAGVDVCRLGLAHGTIPEHQARIARIRAVSERMGQPVAILGDLPGPKIRMGPVLDDAGIFLTETHRLEVWPGVGPTTEDRIHVDYEHLVEDVDVGDSLVLGDGSVRLIAVEKTATHLVVEVEHGGRIQGRPGVTLPSGRLRVSVPTDVDIELLDALAGDLDFVAASFVRSAAEVEEVKNRAQGAAVVAKIETKAAVEALDEIVNISDAVMVARGDLGNECDIAEVPHLQKQIIRQGVAFGVPVITATQMLESMIHSPSPTRAEATDVANAVFDGTTAVMLSAETAIGHNPVLVIKTMAHLCERAEAAADYETWGASLGRIQGQVQLDLSTRITAGMSHAAWRLATELDLDAIISCTNSGYTARAMSRFRPPGVLIGASPLPHTVRQLAMVWGTQPMLVEEYETTDQMVDNAVYQAKQLGYVQIGQIVAVLAGAPDGLHPGTTDVLPRRTGDVTGTADRLDRVWRSEHGSGPTVVLVHGTMDRSTSFGRVVRVLDELHVVRYDRRGYGRSVELGPPRSFGHQVDDLVDVIADQGPVVVGGHSYGGTIALATAARHPDLVAGLVVYECPLPWMDWWPTDSAGARAVSDATDPADAAERFMRRMLGDDRWARLPPSTRKARRAEGETLLAEMRQLREPGPPPFDLAAVTCPVIAASGARGVEHHARAIDTVAADAPKARRLEVDDAGHGVHLTHPAVFAGLIRAMVDETLR